MNRREFTVEAAVLLLGGATIAISGCGGGGVSGPTSSSSTPTSSGSGSASSSAPPPADATGTVSANHGHAAVIAAAHLAEGGALDLDIRGTSSHTHAVSLSAADVVNIRNGVEVQRESSGSSHTHVVTFNAPA